MNAEAAPRDLTALVLAAGLGARMGGPKALLAWPSPEGMIPLALAHARARLAADCERVLVVVAPAVAACLETWLADGARDAAIELVAADTPDAAGSIAAACARGRLGALVLITPVDCPPADPRAVAALRAALLAAPALQAVRPRFAGRGGHPAVLRREALASYGVGSAAPPPLRDTLRALGAGLGDVALDDAAVLADLDTPQSLAAFGCAPPVFLSARGPFGAEVRR